MRGENILGRKNGVIGGRAATDEGGEETLLTNLNFQAKTAKKNQLGQPAVAANEGGEDPSLTNLNF